jgi:hypothetical protein
VAFGQRLGDTDGALHLMEDGKAAAMAAQPISCSESSPAAPLSADVARVLRTRKCAFRALMSRERQAAGPPFNSATPPAPLLALLSLSQSHVVPTGSSGHGRTKVGLTVREYLAPVRTAFDATTGRQDRELCGEGLTPSIW